MESELILAQLRSSTLVVRTIPGYLGFHADSEGYIWGRKNYRLKWQYDKAGYPRVTVAENIKKQVHSLVCLAFHGQKLPGQQIRHLDNDKRNSCPSNLVYGTARENADDSIKHGSQRGSKNGRSKLNETDVAEMRQLFREEKMTQTQLAKKYGVSQPCIFLALQGTVVWKHVPDPCMMNSS